MKLAGENMLSAKNAGQCDGPWWEYLNKLSMGLMIVLWLQIETPNAYEYEA